MTEDRPRPSATPPAARPAARASAHPRDDAPVLPDVSRDETDVGWGDEPAGRDEDWYRRETPPHHGD